MRENAIDPRELRNVMGHFATGVTVITTKDRDEKFFGITANAFTSLSLNPPLVLICVDKSAQCYPCFEESRVFGVNMLAEGQEELSRRFATKGIEKFEGVKYRVGAMGVPLLEGAIGTIECKVARSYDGGDHTIYLGEIVGVGSAAGDPLLFFKGQYRHLAE